MTKIPTLSVLNRHPGKRLFFMLALALLWLTGCDGKNLSDEDDSSSSDEESTYSYSLSGTVTGSEVEGVLITLSGDDSATTTTDSSGYYEFSVANGSYTLTPSLSGYTFTPSSTSVTVADDDATDVDFTDTAATTSDEESDTSDLGDQTDYTDVTLTAGGTYSSADTGVANSYYSYSSSTANTPAVKVESGGDLTLTHSQVTKTGDTSDLENSGFYGFNAGVLVSSSSSDDDYSGTNDTTTLSMTNTTVTTDAAGANGVFAFGEDASAVLDYVTIVTTGDSNSRGVDATYGGSVTISNSTISTQGDSCAALASDRYESYNAPTITASNVYATTSGSGSPGIYCTGTFNVSDSTLIATGSEALAIEGLNSVTLENTSLSGNAKWGAIIYQSMSGDSSVGTGSLSMTGGTLTNNFSGGPLFFVCDTDAVIELDGATLENASDLLLVAGKASTASSYIDNVNSDWGSNGGQVTLTATDQTLEGEIIISDSDSSLDLTLNNSSLSGAINSDNNGGTISVTLDANSSWEITGTSYISSLSNNGTLTGTGTLYVDGTQYDY